MELSYTYAKSIDMGSDDERTVFSSSTGSTVGSSFSAILNAWNPKLSYGASTTTFVTWLLQTGCQICHSAEASCLAATPIMGGIRVIGGWQFPASALDQRAAL